jgi:superfamily II DNA or RNA helicase
LLGPIVSRISPKFLFSKGYATPVKVRIIKLSYENAKMREGLYTIRRTKGENDGSKILAMEKKLVITSKERFDMIVDIVGKTTKNTMVLFSNIKDKYGKSLYDAIRERTGKTVFYIDGGVGQDNRSYFKAEMEEGNDKVLLASFTTFSTGISIKNIHNIFFIESYRSEIIVKQSIGRGMRLLEGKENFTVIDIVDDISMPGVKKLSENYLLRHGKTRLEYYKQYTTDIKVINKSVKR